MILILSDLGLFIFDLYGQPIKKNLTTGSNKPSSRQSSRQSSPASTTPPEKVLYLSDLLEMVEEIFLERARSDYHAKR